MYYPAPLKVKFDPETDQVTLSMQITEDMVIVKKFRRSDFQLMVMQFNAQVDEAFSAKAGE